MALLFVAGCGPRPGPTIPAAKNLGDAPEDLAATPDLDNALSAYRALPVGDKSRTTRRTTLITALAQRAEAALVARRADDAFAAIAELCRLFAPAEVNDPALMEAALRTVQPLIQRLHRSYARSGQTRPAALLITLRRAALPTTGKASAEAVRLDEELQLLLAFADELAITALGENAVRAQPIEILASVVDHLPLRTAVDALVDLYIARQRALAEIFRTQGPSVELIRAHGEGVIRTTWHLVRVFARADRLPEAAPRVGEVVGLGDDEALKAVLGRALAPTPRGAPSQSTAESEPWLALAAQFVTEREEQTDLVAARRIIEHARSLQPRSAGLAERAGQLALAANDPHPARLAFGQAFALEPTSALASSILELDNAEVGRLAFTERPSQARAALDRALAFLNDAHRRWPRAQLSTDRAALLETYGRGLGHIGELSEARKYLEASLALTTRLSTLEFLASMALKTGDHQRALTLYERALALPRHGLEDEYAQLKVSRAAADAFLAAGRTDRAKALYLACVSGWERIPSELPPRFAGERLTELAKARWALGETERALDLFDQAVDADPSGADTYIAVVAHLLTHEQFDRALDAYHRAMGSAEIDDYYKVYMSLWVIAEARRRAQSAPPIASEYLTAREGPLWYDDLARFATGRQSREAMFDRATSKSRRAELLYYLATLGNPALPGDQQRQYLEAVVATEMIMFFEYDMAQMWLRKLAH